MTEEEFIARWSRRKRAAEKEAVRAPAEARSVPGPEPSGTLPPQAGASETPQEDAFDPASLPPIDSITGASDVTAFLRKGVPPELTRAALRRAWTADPAIRDFVGLAENAWDFNDPTAIPGFGTLDHTPEQVRQMVAEMFGEVRQAAAQIADAGDHEQRDDSVRSAGVSTDLSAANDELEPASAGEGLLPAASQENGTEDIAAQKSDAPSGEPRPRRSHGGALPH